MSNPNKKKTSQRPEERFSLPLLLPLIALMTIVPLITYMHTYSTHLEDFDWYTSYAETSDFFLYYKMVWTIIICVVILFCLIYLFLAEERKFLWTKELIPLAVYCGISLISAIVSKYSYFSFHGIFEQFESVWMLIGYGIIVYYGFYVARTQKSVESILHWFMVGILVMSVLGLSQVFSHDFFRTEAGQKLMTPASYEGSVNFTFELGRPYLSLYNPNYVGFYAVLTIPVLAALIFCARKIWIRISAALLIVALVLILFASQSRAGIVALAISFLLMILCMRKVLLKKWWISLSAAVLIIGAFIGVNALNDNVLLNRMKEMFSFEAETHLLEYIETNDDNVTIKYNGNIIVFQVEQDESNNDLFRLTDGEGNQVAAELAEDGSTYRIQDERFPFTFVSSRSDTFNGFVVYMPGDDGVSTKDWYFTNLMKEGDSTFYAYASGKLMKLHQQETSLSFLENHYHFANKRGYIWARTIPLLKKYFFLGSGPDTFIIAFPNDDLVGMYNSGHDNEIITKPHCMYLQIGVQTGVISLIALLTFFGWYLVNSFRLYWKHDYSFLSFIGIGIFASVVGYLILGLTNDSCVAVSPLFYALLGVGVGVNYKVRQERLLAASAPVKVIASSKKTALTDSSDSTQSKPALQETSDTKAAEASANLSPKKASGNDSGSRPAADRKGSSPTNGRSGNSKKKKSKKKR